jgi:two-component system, response regulator, stage 0 sporulation protein F
MVNEKWVLIVDDEDAILAVLQKSLSKLGEDYRVVTAPDGFAALEELKNHSFDLVITDYKMAGMNGMELLGKIKEEQPATRVILMTAYGSVSVEAEAQRMDVYKYLVKPLEIDMFRQIVKEAMQDVGVNRPGILILSDERYREIVQVLNQLQADIGARSIFLTDGEGHFIARVGQVDKLPLEQLAALVGSSVVTLLEAGRIIDGDVDTINLAYREGKRENLYVVNIGHQLLLIFLIERGPYNSRIGSIWYYAQRAARVLQEKIDGVEYASPNDLLGNNLGEVMDDQFDQLFDAPLAPAAKSSEPVINYKAAGLPADADNGTPAKTPAGTAPVKGSPAANAPKASILSFEEAIGAGLLNKKLSSKTEE